MYIRNSISGFLILVLLHSVIATASAQVNRTDSRARRWSRFIEPPPPDPNWNKLRQDQLTFAQLLDELGITVEYKVTGTEGAGGLVELLPEGMQISGALVEGDRFKFELGTVLPKLPGAVQSAMAKVSLEFSANAPTISEVGFEGPISPSTKITANVKYDQIHDPNWAVGVEIQKLFAKFKGEFADGALNRTVEISIVNLFNAARGIVTLEDLPQDLIIKVGTVKFYNAIVKSIKEQTASVPKRGSSVMKGLFVRLNPLLMVAAARNDPSLLSIQNTAIAVQQAMAKQFPKGVKIQYNEELLGEMLQRSKGVPSLGSLAHELDESKTPADKEAKLAKYIERLTMAYRSSTPRQSPREVSLVSLKRLVTQTEKYRDHWSDLPDSLFKPGHLGRIVGYRVDNDNDDIYLIGVPTTSESALNLDEIISGIRGVFVNNESPFCSLDPDPANVGGIQTVRVGGVPVNSRFARTMLDADYLMKKINAGILTINSAAYRPLNTVLRERSDRFEHLFSSRFWFYPVPLRPGNIELSSDGQIVFFSGGMNVLSEHMVQSRDGFVGTGSSDPIANEVAVEFTKALPDIESQIPDVARLHGLFDVVLLCRIWQQLNVKSQWIDRLSMLPTTELAAKTYEGVNVKVYSGKAPEPDIYFTGGVRLRVAAGSRTMVVADDRSQKTIRDASLRRDDSVTTQIEFNGSLPLAANSSGLNLDSETITAMIARGEFDRATSEIQKLLTVNPLDAEVWCLKAENDLQRSRFVSAIDNAERALELAPDDPENQVRASVDLFSAHFMLGETEEALASIKHAAEFVPDSLQARLFYADGLAALGKFEEARKEFRAIQRAFPDQAEAYLRFGVFEITEGNIVTGKQFIDKSVRLSRTDQAVAAGDSALSLAEAGIAMLENPESHLQKAQSLANRVLADKAADPISRLRALMAKSIIALAKENLSEAESIAQQVMRITPANPTVLLSIAQWAHYTQKPELALEYLARAERIAPNMPLVKAVGAKIRGNQ